MENNRCLIITTIIVLSVVFRGANTNSLSEMQKNELLSNSNLYVPPVVNDSTVQDNIQLYIVSIASISTTKMEYEMTFYLRQRWLDQRLAYNYPDVDVVEMDKDNFYSFWTPNIYIVNQKESDLFDSEIQSKLINIYPSGELLHSSRISGIFTCEMDFSMYPFDSQVCDIKFGSYSLSNRTLVIRWQELAVEFSKDFALLEFELTKTETFICDQKFFTANYTCAGLHMHLSRYTGYYITHIYIPSILIVMLSWISFWFGTDAAMPRLSLGVVTVLAVVALGASSNVSKAKIPYSTLLDVWLAVCNIFVFAAFLVFIFMHLWISQFRQRRPTVTADGVCDKTEEVSDVDSNRNQERARMADIICRFLFPVFFGVFNIVYWIYCAA